MKLTILLFALGVLSLAALSLAEDSGQVNMTVCKDVTCDQDCKAYLTPIGTCYRPSILFPHDEQWGIADVHDSCSEDGKKVTRSFYDSTDGTCKNQTDAFTIDTSACVGPFGRPRPAGIFVCQQGRSEERNITREAVH